MKGSIMKEYESRKDMLLDLIQPGSTIAEIGVFTGDFAEWILNTLKPKKYYGVDPYTSTIGVMGSGNQDGYNMEFYENELLYHFVKNRFYNFPEAEFIRDFSHHFFERTANGSLDAVYIDGDHSESAVKSDLELARKAVKEGGWIFGHDYEIHPTRGNKDIKNVTKNVVDDFCKEHNLEVYAVANDGILSFAIQNRKKYTFTIVSVSDRPELYLKTFLLMEQYVEKHKYKIQLHYKSLCEDRHPSWSKILALQKALETIDTDFVVWMDDDIMITNPEISLSSFVDNYGFNNVKAFTMVSSDMPNEPSTFMNCGIMFFKTKGEDLEKTKKILGDAWVYGDVSPLIKKDFSWEQEAFNFFYRYGYRDQFLIVPLPNFQGITKFDVDPKVTWKPGMLSAHLNCGGTEKKIQMFHLINKILKL